MPEVRRAALADLDILIPLFDAYRQFYRRASDPMLARTFLRERLERDESVIFLATQNDAPAGFTQLYPSFSSAAAARIYVLNDLYVAPAARRCGVGAALLRHAAEFGRTQGAVRLALATEISNLTAQSLYGANGWVRDATFYHYNLAL